MLRDSGYCDSFCDSGGGTGKVTVTTRQPLIQPPLIAMGTEERHSQSTPLLPGTDVDDLNKDSRVTGPSCRALRHAVAGLNRLDDFSREKIGSGFFSEVFKVTHRVTGEVMVLKMNLLRSNRPNMLKEVQLMNQLCHPNVLGFMGVCVHEGQLHALTEYINGGSLEQLIQTRSLELTYCVRMKLALDIAKGMEYLHSRDVFHRDLTSKNVLIKKNEMTGEMTAVVGDFGLAAKIPRSGFRLPTVGSPYWMSPECLKGQWYDQSSDVFSYGIILCELIARIEADPDVLPRTENFGLDYLAFVELCSDPPPDFLKLAFSCCNFEPKNRPTFNDIVKSLGRSLESLVTSNISISVLPSNVIKTSSNLGARSEEVLPTGNSLPQPSSSHRKLSHRRSLSEDIGMLVFPPHTAPSDKARCHFVPSTPLKHVGEAMAREDPHYKPFPSKANPFSALGQFKGVKILASTNSTDLFSSCFELPSPSPYRTETKSNPFDSSFDTSLSDKLNRGVVSDSWKRNSVDVTVSEPSIVIEPVIKPSHILKTKQKSHNQKELKPRLLNAGGNNVCNNLVKDSKKAVLSSVVDKSSSSTIIDSSVASDDDEHTLKHGNSSVFRVEPPRYYTELKTKPLSLPSSPTFSRRKNTITVLTNDLFNRFTTNIKPQLSKFSGDDDSKFCFVHNELRKNIPSLYSHPLFKNRSTHQCDDTKQMVPLHPLRTCSSSSNLVTIDDIPGSPGGAGTFFNHSNVIPTIQGLRRRGSCESGFFSNLGEDFCLPGVEMVTASSVTLSSSSAASSLFLDSGATVSCSLEDIATPLRGHSTPGTFHHNQHKRSSSVYTDSSEDVSSLGGGDLPTWEDRSLLQAPQQISKIVEYFERKQSNISMPSSSSSTTSSLSSNKWGESTEQSSHPSLSQRYQLHREYYQLRRCYLQEGSNRQSSSNDQSTSSASKINNIPQPSSYKRGINQRLMICEGAVRSKLPIFDKKINNNSNNNNNNNN
ncbi:serine/threonine kinase [Lycorma delicatula]|uniref:serine/threonine kinase n=1 Tax=Lycorma delicatula TaxID=130591 RepID=UPI003F512960